MSFKLDYTLSHPPKAGPSNPPGFAPPTSAKDLARQQRDPVTDPAALAQQARRSNTLKMRRAWDLALSPAKSLPMQAVMLYFSGSGIQIFSLGMIFMLLTSPISAVLGILRAFEAFRPTPPGGKDGKLEAAPSYAPLAAPMLLYIACQGLTLALGLYKCSTMGILPTGTSDWLGFETRNPPPEWSANSLTSFFS